MIKVRDLWKCFPLDSNKKGLKEFIVSMPRQLDVNKKKFWALKGGICFDVKEGECLGIIGRNGSGKSTLLSLLLGVMCPTRGTVEVKGKRTPLLALGAGFHPDLTGYENVIMNGVLLGNTEQEVRRKIDTIIEFSELGDVIGRPVRTYSSGMYLRLAFSVAIHMKPEILLIDEILAVGDESFRAKSSAALKGLIKEGVTTVYVSHSMSAIRDICDRVIWLDKGKVRAEGKVEEVVKEYKKCFAPVVKA